jgi:hypothetical protein
LLPSLLFLLSSPKGIGCCLVNYLAARKSGGEVVSEFRPVKAA